MNMARKPVSRWKQTPAWLVSLMVHAAILALFAVTTWMVVEKRQVDRSVLLTEGTAKTGDDDGGNAGGSAQGRSSSGGTVASRHQVVAPSPLVQGEVAAAISTATDHLAPTPGLGGHAPSALGMGTLADGLAGAGSGNGVARGVGEGFAGKVGTMRKRGLDVVLVIDATDSMVPYIEQAKGRLGQVIEVVTSLVPDARFGVVAYKDYGDEYGRNAVRFIVISAKAQSASEFIQAITAGGGADEPEPIQEALAVATDLKGMGWRSGAEKVIILVGDSPIHSSGRKQALELAQQFAARAGGTINVLDTGGTADPKVPPRKEVRPDLAQIAAAAKGSAFLLTDRDAFWRHLIVSVFGKEYEQDVNTIISRVAPQP